MKLTLPLPPNRANAREHWRTTHRKKSAYYAAAHIRILQQTRPVERNGRFAVPMLVSATLYVWNRFDDDGATALLKWPLDALVRAGVLRDDRRPHCILSGIPEQTVDRKNRRLEITLEAL